MNEDCLWRQSLSQADGSAQNKVLHQRRIVLCRYCPPLASLLCTVIGWVQSGVCVCSVVSDSLPSHGRLQPTRFLCPWNSPGKNTGLSCHFLLHGIFPTQGLNLSLLCLLHFQEDFFFFFFFFYTTSPLRKPTATGRVPLLKMLCWLLKVQQLRTVGQQVSSQILYF